MLRLAWECTSGRAFSVLSPERGLASCCWPVPAGWGKRWVQGPRAGQPLSRRRAAAAPAVSPASLHGLAASLQTLGERTAATEVCFRKIHSQGKRGAANPFPQPRIPTARAPTFAPKQSQTFLSFSHQDFLFSLLWLSSLKTMFESPHFGLLLNYFFHWNIYTHIYIYPAGNCKNVLLIMSLTVTKWWQWIKNDLQRKSGHCL